ncbi:MAG: hypothetical protein JKX69_03485 [Rhodobacteraceae bacterium]|nr:hypothetical protein [Paracoccaceae bacterium]
MPSVFAMLMLALWPVVSVVLFRTLPAGRALLASILIAYLFLPPPPAAFDFPGLPPFNKDTIPAIVALIMSLILYREEFELLPVGKFGKVLVVVFILSPVATALTNADPVFYGSVGLPGLRMWDAIAMVVQQALVLTPFLLARNFLCTAESQRDILLALVIGGLVYSAPMLLEVRLSPQLNVWFYGYFQHAFEQVMRDGGFRPIVFLYHGLWVAFFCMTTVLAAVALARVGPFRRFATFGAIALYLFVVLVLCKSLASILYALAFAPLIGFASARFQIRFAAFLAFLAIAYPIAKGADLVPQERILAAAASASGERAYSLQFRFDNETILLERAYERPLFGWGSWGRNHVLDEVSGQILTITDGRWIILIGVFGWVGFLAEMGLLTLPLFMLWRRSNNAVTEAIGPWLGPLALIIAVNVIDLIPNATITPLTWMFAGGLFGFAEGFKPVQRRALAPIRTVL